MSESHVHPPSGGGRARINRRTFLKLAPAAAATAAAAAGGAYLLTRADVPTQVRNLGADAMLAIRRGHDPVRAGQLQLIPQVGNTVVRGEIGEGEIRSSHPLPWRYVRGVPLIFYGPGYIQPGHHTAAPATLADLAPTYARLMGFEDYRAPDGAPLTDGIDLDPEQAPALIVTVVIDGGGWNALRRWPRSWPNIAALREEGTSFDRATIGSSPSVTASIHATIGTGAFPRTHGITGHWIRRDGRIQAAYDLRADPSALRTPTLGDLWGIHTGGRAWVGLVGYQDWHLGMLGHGSRHPGADAQFMAIWDREAGGFGTLGSPAYRFDDSLISQDPYRRYLRELDRADGAEDGTFRGKVEMARAEPVTWPIVRYTVDLIEAVIGREGVGRRDVTDLLYVNFKAPDYAGHTFGLHSIEEDEILLATDEQIARIRQVLDDRVGRGRYVLVLTADHGQCYYPKEVGSLQIGLSQLEEDLLRHAGEPSTSALIEQFQPGEAFLDESRMRTRGIRLEDLATFVRRYTLEQNASVTRPREGVPRHRLSERLFAAALTSRLIESVDERTILRLGRKRLPSILERTQGSEADGIAPDG